MTITNFEDRFEINGVPIIAPELFTVAVHFAHQIGSLKAKQAVEIWIEKMVGVPLKMTSEQLSELRSVICDKQQQPRLTRGDKITVFSYEKEPVAGFVYFSSFFLNEIMYVKAEGFDPAEHDPEEWMVNLKYQTANGFVVRGWLEPEKVS